MNSAQNAAADATETIAHKVGTTVTNGAKAAGDAVVGGLRTVSHGLGSGISGAGNTVGGWLTGLKRDFKGSKRI